MFASNQIVTHAGLSYLEGPWTAQQLYSEHERLLASLMVSLAAEERRFSWPKLYVRVSRAPASDDLLAPTFEEGPDDVHIAATVERVV